MAVCRHMLEIYSISCHLSISSACIFKVQKEIAEGLFQKNYLQPPQHWEWEVVLLLFARLLNMPIFLCLPTTPVLSPNTSYYYTVTCEGESETRLGITQQHSNMERWGGARSEGEIYLSPSIYHFVVGPMKQKTDLIQSKPHHVK